MRHYLKGFILDFWPKIDYPSGTNRYYFFCLPEKAKYAPLLYAYVNIKLSLITLAAAPSPAITYRNSQEKYAT